MKSLAALLLLFVLMTGCKHEPETNTVYRNDGDPVTQVKDDDAEMNAAIAKAKSTLDSFIAELKKPGTRNFGVKVEFPTPHGGGEHMWLLGVTYAEGKFKGTLADKPMDLPDKHEGDVIEVDRKDVSDWLIEDNGKMTGAFTNAVLEQREKKP